MLASDPNLGANLHQQSLKTNLGQTFPDLNINSTQGQASGFWLLISNVNFHPTKQWKNSVKTHMDIFMSTSMSTSLLEDNRNAIEAKPISFLSLPGEIRNIIYRHAFSSPKTYTVNLQFDPSDTALLYVQKQISFEASTIFYHENIFRFPQPLFVGGPILERIKRVYDLPPRILQTMRSFVIEVPVCFPLDRFQFLRLR